MRSISGRDRIFGHEDGFAECDDQKIDFLPRDLTEEPFPSILLRFCSIPKQIRLLRMP